MMVREYSAKMRRAISARQFLDQAVPLSDVGLTFGR